MAVRTIDEARAQALRYTAEQFPGALAVLLTGSWARGGAHADSDLDVVIVDESVDRVMFEGVMREGWAIDVCVLNPHHAESFFNDSARYRSAPIPHQVADSILIAGEQSLGDRIRRLAADALARGPEPIAESDRLEMRFDITLLRHDLRHSSTEALPALAAWAHVQLSRALLDARRCWRADRKALRRAVSRPDPGFAELLDTALIDGVAGDPSGMVKACDLVLDLLGGPLRTYERFFA